MFDLISLAALLATAAIAFLILSQRPGRKHRGELQTLLSDTRHIKAQPHSIFISYRRKDSAETVGRLYDHLVQAYGREAVFKDVDAIGLGQDFRKALEKGLASCTVFVCVIGPRWSGSSNSGGADTRAIDDTGDFVRIEVETALDRGLVVIPLLVHSAAMPAAESLPPALRELAFRQAQPLRTDPDFVTDMQRLCGHIDAHLTVR